MRIKSRLGRISIVGVCCAALGGGFATAGVMTASAVAPTSCVVNNTGDAVNGGIGTCDTAVVGQVTLRSAIGAFTAAPSVGFTITFNPSTNGTPIALSGGVLPITGNGSASSIVITGNGTAPTVVNAHHASRLVTVSGASVPDVTFNNLTLENGQELQTAGITTSGTLTLSGVTLSGMIVNVGHVAGASIHAGTLNITNSTITGDLSTSDTTGGADGTNQGEIVSGTTTITNSSITTNTVTSMAGHINDGLLATSGITVTGSHIDGNTINSTTTGSVGGVFDSSATTIHDSSVNNNTLTTGSGATVSGVFSTSAMDFERSTANGNTLTALGNGSVDAVFSSSATTIKDASVNNNTLTTGSSGSVGGVFSTSATDFERSSANGNTLTALGSGSVDGVFSSSATTIKDASVDNNTFSTGASGTTFGVLDTSNLDLERSSISGNSFTLGDLGAGDAIIFPGDSNTILDSTISSNTFTVGRSATLTGFVYEGNSDGNLLTNFTNDTIAKNTLSQLNTVPAGGSFSTGSGGTIIFSNDIISGNTPSNCDGTALPSGKASHSLDSGTDCGMGTTNGNLSSTDPKLGPLQVNAPGTSRTMAIDSTSPAFNTADNATCPTVDQRGVTRLQTGDQLCDMGAYEAVLAAAVAPLLPAAGHPAPSGQPPVVELGLLLMVVGALVVGAGWGVRGGWRRA